MKPPEDNLRLEHPAVSAPRLLDRSFILLRFTLIIATCYLLIAEYGARSVPLALVAMMIVVLVSNLGALAIPAAQLRAPWFIAATIVGDTVWITIALIATGRFTSEFFYLYFFVIFLAGVGENLRLIALGVTVVCVAYVVLVARTGGLDEVVNTQTLIRVPFLFSVAIFYGYLVDRLRKERHQLSQEQAVVEGLERNRRALAEANEELRRLSDVKSKFVSTVSHELKSPLTAIKNAVSLIEPGADGESNEKLLEMIRRNADRLDIIIADLLDMSKAESGSLTIAADTLDLRPFLSQVMEPFETQAEGAGIGISIEIKSPESLPSVLADANRIEQVVANLLSNALKATPKGGSITLAVEDGGADWITIRVTDDGVGLSAEDQTKVFEPFFQAENTLEGKPAGTGLGLTICRDLIRGHGSELRLESELGVGSSFSFSLPVQSDRARETIAFENQVRTTFRAHPYFAILIVDGSLGTSSQPAGPTLDAARDRLAKILPRELDVLCEQPAHGRIIIVMLSTPLGGGWVVKRKLASAFAPESARDKASRWGSFKVLGPAGFPDDGEHGSILIDRATELGEQLEERS